ncbi:hypothetical protein MATL_G00100350 [Megalops atlanticus]|uniref:Uncharacterized protein n=1 Tax=Megalops atlanticus TaxID=7932 RepID=A0A9D3Q1N0_MEGAT|nr:hypothetical protein MATL_G00100350 [Megalops atlanticus]
MFLFVRDFGRAEHRWSRESGKRKIFNRPAAEKLLSGWSTGAISRSDRPTHVKDKFGLPDAAELHIFDEIDTAVEEDILLELIEASPDLCLTVCNSISDEDISL